MGMEEEELLEGTECREYSMGAAVGTVGNDQSWGALASATRRPLGILEVSKSLLLLNALVGFYLVNSDSVFCSELPSLRHPKIAGF